MRGLLTLVVFACVLSGSGSAAVGTESLRDQARARIVELRQMRDDPDRRVSGQMYVAMCEEAEQIFADDPMVQAELGVAYQWAGNPLEAEARFERAHALAPEWGVPMVGLGRTQLDLGRPEKAREWCQRATQAERTLPDVDAVVLLLETPDFGMRLATLEEPQQRQEIEIKICAHWANRALQPVPGSFVEGDKLVTLLVDRDAATAETAFRVKGGKSFLPVKLLYEFDEANPRPHELQLDELGSALYRYRVRYESVRIIGHASTDGGPDYNMDLSKRRARNIADYLVDEWKVDPDRLDVCWAGETDPVHGGPNVLEASRRVEFTYVEYDESAGVSIKGFGRYRPPKNQSLRCWGGNTP